MSVPFARIQPLPSEIQDKIRPSVAITISGDVVLELLKVALDVGADSMEVKIDLLKGYCAVSDNGVGISTEEFEENAFLGKMHFKAIRLLKFPVLFVRDLFGNIPVCLKRRVASLEDGAECSKEFDNLKTRVVALLLAWLAPVNVTLCDLNSKHSYMNRAFSSSCYDIECMQKSSRFALDHICGDFARAGFTPCYDREKWISSDQTASVSVRAAISLNPVPTWNRQFMSLRNKPIDQHRAIPLYDEVNRLFEVPAFGVKDGDAALSDSKQLTPIKPRGWGTDRPSLRQLRGVGRKFLNGRCSTYGLIRRPPTPGLENTITAQRYILGQPPLKVAASHAVFDLGCTA